MNIHASWLSANPEVFRSISSRQNYQFRLRRYDVPTDMFAFARPQGMRCYCFPLRVKNLSGSGFLMVSESSGHVPFKIGSVLQMTVDLYCVLFSRPLHVLVEVRRVVDLEKGDKEFGVVIAQVEPSQRHLFWRGFEKLGPPDAME